MTQEKPHIDFIGIGTSKSGTNWIRTCIKAHPEVFLPPHSALKYFDSIRYDPQLKEFLDQFEFATKEKAIGEFTPRYYCSIEAIERLALHFPKAKIIVSLRNPVERTLSQYRYNYYRQKKEVNQTFSDALQDSLSFHYLDKSLYFKHLKRVFELFPRQQIHIIRYQNIIDTPLALLKDLYEFLEVDSTFIPQNLTMKINNTPKSGLDWKKNLLYSLKANKNNKVDLRLIATKTFIKKSLRELKFIFSGKGMSDLIITQEDQLFLYEQYFREDIENLELLTGMDFAEWKKF